MDRKERRRRERERKKIEENLRKETSRPDDGNTKRPTRLRRLSQFFPKTISGTKLLWRLFAAGLTITAGYALFHPHISLEPGIVLNPGDQLTTQFDAVNDSPIFNINNLKPSCYTLLVETTNRVTQRGLPGLPSPTVPVLGPKDRTTIVCRPWVGGLGAGAGNVTTAYIVMAVSYEQDWWPFSINQRFPLKGVIDSQNHVFWTHITASELRNMSPQPPVSK
jgi:hypothetical protein